MLTETITIKPQSLRVVLALANDVVFAEKDLEKAITDLNDKNNYPVKFDIVWCNEQFATDEQSDWSSYFYYETPIPLIERINEVHKPDFIICVFWKLFGLNQYFPTDTPEQAKQKAEEAAQKWTKKDFPKTKVLFCKQDPKLSIEEDKNKRLFISYFRSQVDEAVLGSCNKNQIAKEIVKILFEFTASIFGDKSDEDDQWQKYKPSSLLELKLPDDWLYLNRWLNEKSALIGQELDDAAAANFFNGKIPSLTEALSSSIPRRAIVKDLLKIITKAATDRKFAVTLLLGPGGEGKSTILQQVAFDLIRQRKPEIQVVFRQQSESLLKVVENLQNKKGNFVIVSDDAQKIAKDISKIVKRFDKPDNIQFLLASRTTHWEWESSTNSDLQTHLGDNFVRRRIILTEKDAEKIVDAWKRANALGKLKNEKEPVKRLLDEASLKSDKSGKQNSFFSAILWVRKHQTLDARVKDILDGLKEKPSLNGKTLDYYYNYIIALHGDSISILTDSILQQALGCDKTKLEKEVLAPLKGETAILQEGALILARHDLFAERAKEILKSRIDFNKIIGELSVAAEKLYLRNELGSNEINKWLDLENHYFKNRKEPEVALSIVKALGEEKDFAHDSVMFTQWARLLRKWADDLEKEAKELKRKHRFGEAQEKFNEAEEKRFGAANVLCKYYDQTKPRRSYFTEWGVIQGEIGNSFFDAWLTSISLTNDFKEKRNLANPHKMELAALATAFSNSYLKTISNEADSIVFKKAAEGAVRLGSDEKANKHIDFPEITEFRKFNYHDNKKNLQIALNKVKSDDVSKINLENAFQAILDGINLAWKLCEVDRENLPESLPNAPDLNFNKLKKMFGIKTKPEEFSPTSKAKLVVEPTESIKETLNDSNSGFAFRRVAETDWQIIFKNKDIPLKETTGVRFIYKLFLEHQGNSRTETRIPAKTLFEQDGKNSSKTSKQLRGDLESHIKTVINNISLYNAECSDYFEKTVKARLISSSAFLCYEPINPEPEWKLS